MSIETFSTSGDFITPMLCRLRKNRPLEAGIVLFYNPNNKDRRNTPFDNFLKFLCSHLFPKEKYDKTAFLNSISIKDLNHVYVNLTETLDRLIFEHSNEVYNRNIQIELVKENGEIRLIIKYERGK